MNKNIVSASLLLVAVGMVFWFIGAFNGFQKLDESINSKWAQVENQLQRRSDLIPNLVATVKGYAKHEKGVYEDIANARAKMGSVMNNSNNPAALAKAEGEFNSALSRLMVVVENYPNLKANEQFKTLSGELSGTENRLAVARRDYNEEVKLLNSQTRMFPGNLIAMLSGIRSREYFEAPEAAKKNVSVDFATP